MAVINLNTVATQNRPSPFQGEPIGDVVRNFQDAIVASGLGRPEIAIDSKLHRFDTPTDKAGDKSGWYVLFVDCTPSGTIPAGAFGSWREGETHTWVGKSAWDMTAHEQEKVNQRVARAKEMRAVERRREADETAAAAKVQWARSQEADPQHPYLENKGVMPLGVRQQGEVLVIPMIDASGDLRGLQRVYPNGDKRFSAGVEKKGCFHWIGGDDSVVYLCEGFATGASLHMATGHSIVVAFDAGNLAPVAKIVRERMPQTPLVIAADNDRWTKKQDGTPWNTGLRAAERAAKDVNATMAWPEFKDLSTRPTDFNDLHKLEGAAEVRAQAAHRGAGPRITDWGLDLFEGPAPVMRWLVKDTLPLACPCLLAAAGGTGKGMLALDLALRVASGTPEVSGAINLNRNQDAWLGSSVEDHGAVVILTAEDSRDTIHQRLEALDPDGARRVNAKGRLYIVPLPNAGGPMQLVISAGYNAGYKNTEAFDALRRQLRRIPDLKLINIDPLASFVGVDVNADPQAGAYVQGVLASLAEETGACVLVAHHMTKPPKTKEKATAESARNAIRGTSALVDGVRLALAVWQASGQTVGEVRKAVDKPGLPSNMVFEAAVVKSNAPAKTDVRVLMRAKSGLLESCDASLRNTRPDKPVAMNMIVSAVSEAAKDGRPFSKSGSGGIWKRQEELPDALRGFGRNKIADMVQELLNDGQLVACTLGKTQANWLDVPGGDFALGIGEFKVGASCLECECKNNA